MYRRLILPSILGVVAALGGNPLLMNQPIINQPALAERMFTAQRLRRSSGGQQPRDYNNKRERQRPPRKNSQHRKHARAKRRAARLRRSL